MHDLAAKSGFIWGGDWQGRDYDPMHVQWGGSKPWLAGGGAGAGGAQAPAAPVAPLGGPAALTAPVSDATPYGPTPDQVESQALQIQGRADKGEISQDQADAANRRLYARYGQWKARTSGDRKALLAGVSNGIAMLADGRDWTAPTAAINTLLPDRADALNQTIEDARDQGRAKNQIAFASPAELVQIQRERATRGSTTPPTTPGNAAATRRLRPSGRGAPDRARQRPGAICARPARDRRGLQQGGAIERPDRHADRDQREPLRAAAPRRPRSGPARPDQVRGRRPGQRLLTSDTATTAAGAAARRAGDSNTATIGTRRCAT